jgi:hypothetical protein
MRQLRELATPFPPSLVHKAPQGKYGDYVPHSSVVERALSIVGPYSFEIVELIRGWTPEVVTKRGKPDEKVWPAREAVVGCLARLTVEIDGRTVTVVEVGDVEGAAAQEDGANAKEASSDALKRCWMRLGLGLHLWSQDSYFLDKQLDKLLGQEQLPGLDGAAPGGAGRAGSPPPPPAGGES